MMSNQESTHSQSPNIESFEAIRVYDWAADLEFQGGLQSILSSVPSPSPEQSAELTQRARCFFYSKMTGVKVDYAAYKAWLLAAPLEPPRPGSANQSRRDDSTIITAHPALLDATDPPPPQAPSPGEGADGGGGGTTDPPYPMSFARIVELISTGQPIPGIRVIPSTLNSAPPSEAMKPQRPKPWEKRSCTEGGEVGGRDASLPT